MKNNKKPLSISVDDVKFVVDYLKKNKKPNSKVKGLLKRSRGLLKKGDEQAANLFGILYADALLFNRDFKKSIELFLMGEKTGCPKMICNAGRSYMNMSFDDALSQKEQERLFDKALEYVTRAANMNHIPAIKYLARIHTDWLYYMPCKAIQDFKLDLNFENFDVFLLVSNAAISPVSVKEKCLIGKELLEKAAELGDDDSLLKIAELYIFGELEDTKDGKNAREYLFKAAEKGSPSACQMLGQQYASEGSYIVEHDELKAFTWTLKAAEAGDDVAMLDLIQMYRDGIGVEKNSEKSLYWKNKFEALPQ